MSDQGKRDDARKMILARRASFVAAALAAVACQKEPAEQPQPCLSVPIGYPPDAASEPPPQPCLSPPPNLSPPQPDAQDAGAPQPCLSVAPEPQPCLKVKPPADAGTKPPPPPQPCLSPMRPEEKK